MKTRISPLDCWPWLGCPNLGVAPATDESDEGGKKRKGKAAAKAAPKKMPDPPARRVSTKSKDPANKSKETKDPPSDPHKPSEMILGQCQKTLQLLSELTGEAIWKSMIRANELDRRVSKALTSQGELDKIAANDKADKSQKQRALELEDKISAKSKVVVAFKEVCRVFRSEPAELAQEIRSGTVLKEHLKKCSPMLFSEPNILMDMIHVVAKKLFEVGRNLMLS